MTYNSPNSFSLKAIAYPNPFSPDIQRLTIKPDKNTNFSPTSKLDAVIYDIHFRRVFEDDMQREIFYWSGFTRSGVRVPPGIYFVFLIEEKEDSSIGQTWLRVLVI